LPSPRAAGAALDAPGSPNAAGRRRPDSRGFEDYGCLLSRVDAKDERLSMSQTYLKQLCMWSEREGVTDIAGGHGEKIRVRGHIGRQVFSLKSEC